MLNLRSRFLVISLVAKVVFPSVQGKMYNLDDFNPMFFPVNWFIVYDKLGS